MLNRLNIVALVLIISCQNVSEYERIVKEEMAKGVYIDSVKFANKEYALSERKKDLELAKKFVRKLL